MLQLLLNNAELELLDTFETVGHGEILHVKASAEPPHTNKQVSHKTARFFATLRGAGSFDKVIVHDSEPAYAENSRTINQLECLVKTKF